MSLLQSRHKPVALAVTAAALVLIGGVYVSTTIGLGRAVEPRPDATSDPTLDVSAVLTPELDAGEASYTTPDATPLDHPRACNAEACLHSIARLSDGNPSGRQCLLALEESLSAL